MSGSSKFFALVEEGRKGGNVGMPLGSQKLTKYTDGYLGGTTFLIGGASGSSKSTFMLYHLVYCPLIAYLTDPYFKSRDPYWLLFNLEMTQPQIYAKLVSMYIFDQFHIQLRFKEIFSRGKDCILSDENFELLKKCQSFLDELDKRLICVDGALNEEKYVKVVDKVLTKFGKWDNGNYIPNNPNQVLGCGIDHMSLIQGKGRSKKDEIDAIDSKSVEYRNKTTIFSPIHVAQFNRGAGSDERLKQDMQEPNANDFKDTGSIYESAQVVFAVHSPHKFKKSTYHKYNIKILEQEFIAAHVLKTRFGTSDFWVGLGFYGDCSHYYDLPLPDEIYDYDKYKTPYWVFDKKDVTKKEDEQPKQKPKFTL